VDSLLSNPAVLGVGVVAVLGTVAGIASAANPQQPSQAGGQVLPGDNRR